MKEKFKSEIAFLENIDFKSKVMDSIPGIVFLYEITQNGIKLIKWNNFLNNLLEYSDDELPGKSITDFHSPEEIQKIRAAMESALETKKGRLETKVLSKSGKEYPVLVTGYLFQHHGKNYLIGVGTLLTYQKEIERQLKLAERAKKKEEEKKIRLAKELAQKKRELVSIALENSSTAEVINEVIKTVDGILPNHNGCKHNRDLYIIKQKLELYLVKQNNWDIFRERFKEVHPDFFSGLKKAYPNLTKSELKFAAYLRIHLSSSQIMAALNVSKEAIRKTRYRIRKKTGLDPRDLLEDFITKF